MENANPRGAVITAEKARMKKAATRAGKPLIILFPATTLLSTGSLAHRPGAVEQRPANPPVKSTPDLAAATRQYKASLEALLPIYEAALTSATRSFEERKGLFAQGVISRGDLEASQQASQEAQARVEETRRQISESDQLLAEALAEPEPVKPAASPRQTRTTRYRTTAAVSRFSSSGGWSLTQASQVQSFFISIFGRQLPISAFGQSATHNRMGFDHRNSMDVALHPDSPEGKVLIAYLRGNGIPHLIFRSAVAGAATGAHIHVGYPSHRM